MSFTDAVRSAMRNYANFNGRARRSEYWYLVLAVNLVSLLAVVPYFAPLVSLFLLAAAIPSLSCLVRRLHDTGRGGLYALIAFVPLAGIIVLIYWLCQDSQAGANAYGTSPKYARTGGNINPNLNRGQLCIQCVSGPLQGQIYPVGRKLLIGRDASCYIRMPDGTPGLSAKHCAVRAAGNGATLEDLNSSHGTFLADGRRLMPNNPEAIAVGTQFYLGSNRLAFRLVRQ